MAISSLRPEEKTFRRARATLHGSPPPCSSGRYFRSDGARPGSPIVEKPPAMMLKMENVRILKRGTPAESHLFAEKAIGVGAPDCRKSTDSSAEFYAGGGYATSPDPSCLPRPAFLLKEKGAATSFSFFSPGMFERFVLAHQVRPHQHVSSRS